MVYKNTYANLRDGGSSDDWPIKKYHVPWVFFDAFFDVSLEAIQKTLRQETWLKSMASIV